MFKKILLSTVFIVSVQLDQGFAMEQKPSAPQAEKPQSEQDKKASFEVWAARQAEAHKTFGMTQLPTEVTTKIGKMGQELRTKKFSCPTVEELLEQNPKQNSIIIISNEFQGTVDTTINNEDHLKFLRFFDASYDSNKNNIVCYYSVDQSKQKTHGAHSTLRIFIGIPGSLSTITLYPGKENEKTLPFTQNFEFRQYNPKDMVFNIK